MNERNFSNKHIYVKAYNQHIKEDNLVKCPKCGSDVLASVLKWNAMMCDKCDHAFRMDSFERERMIVDPTTFKEINSEATFANLLKFPDYAKRAQMDTKRYGIKEVI